MTQWLRGPGSADLRKPEDLSFKNRPVRLVPPPEGPRWSVEHWGTDSVNCPACRKALDEAPVTEEEEG